MMFDGSSPTTCKSAALLLAGGIHLLAFSLADFDISMPAIPQPTVTRMILLPPAPVPAPPAVEPAKIESPPAPITPEPQTLLQEEPSPVELPDEGSEDESEPIQETAEEQRPEEIVSEESPPAPQEVVQEPATIPVSPEVSESAQPVAIEAPEDSDGKFDVAPAVYSRIKPEYPLSARQAKVEGDVGCELLVSKRGRVLEAAVVSSSGHKEIDDAAVKALRAARFSPATKRGRPVEARVRLVVEFNLSAN